MARKKPTNSAAIAGEGGMILRLAVEQLRARWRSTAWSGLLLAFALGLGSYAMVMAATVVRFQDDGGGIGGTFENPTGSIAGPDTSWGEAWAFVGPGEALPEAGRLPDGSPVRGTPTFAELERTAAASTVPIGASTTTVARIHGLQMWIGITSIRDFDWDAALVEGAPPGAGEIALRADVARRLGVGIGDSVPLDSALGGYEAETTRVVSGISRVGDAAPFALETPDAYASWEDVPSLHRDLPSFAIEREDGTWAAVADVIVSWNGSAPGLDPYLAFNRGPGGDGGLSLSRGYSALGNAGWALLVAIITVLALIVAAFGMGRAQAEARTQWVATARALGAKRGDVAAATLTETAILAAAVVTVGLGVGVAAASLHLGILRSTRPDALLPSSVSVPLPVVLSTVAVGVLLTAVLAAVPSFWASRVAPVAALKPETPISQAQLSRTVAPWWPTVIAGGAMATWSGLYAAVERGDGGSGGSWLDLALWLTWMVGVVAGVTLAIQAARTTVSLVGRALARSRRTWVLAAGDALLARGRLYTFAALGMALGTGAFAFALTSSAASAYDHRHEHGGWGEFRLVGLREWWSRDVVQPGVLAVAAIVLAVVVLVAVVVTLSAHAARGADDATRAALGLSDVGARVGATIGQWAVMATGAAWGGVVGWALPIVFHVLGAALSPRQLALSFGWNATVAGHGLVAAGVVVAIAWALSLAGALVVGLASRTGTPVEALRRSAG